MEIIPKIFLAKDIEYNGNGILELVPANMVIPTEESIKASTLVELRRYLYSIECSTHFTAKLDIEGPTASSIVLSEGLGKVLSSLEGARVTVKIDRSDLHCPQISLPIHEFLDPALRSCEAATELYRYTSTELPSARGRPSTVDCYVSWHNKQIYLKTEPELAALIEKNVPPDMVISMEGERFPCHRTLWEARNLTSIFSRPLQPISTVDVEIPKMSLACLRVLLKVIYNERDGLDLRTLPIPTMYEVYAATIEHLPGVARDIKAIFMGTEPMDHLPYFVWAFYHKTRVYENPYRNPFEDVELQTYCLRIFNELKPSQMNKDKKLKERLSSDDLNLQQFMEKSAAFEI